MRARTLATRMASPPDATIQTIGASWIEYRHSAPCAMAVPSATTTLTDRRAAAAFLELRAPVKSSSRPVAAWRLRIHQRP